MSDPSVQSGNIQFIGNMGGGGGGGGGTPNVLIAGTDAAGLPIPSPLLTGDDGLDNVSLANAGNVNLGWRSVVVGTQNNVTGDNSFVSGFQNGVFGDRCTVSGSNNSVDGYDQSVSGYNNILEASTRSNEVSGENHDLTGSTNGCHVSGVGNTIANSFQMEVSGQNHDIASSQLTSVSGNANKLVDCVNSRISGYGHDVASLSGTGADYNDVSGDNHFVRGDSNHVSGNNNDVQAIAANVNGTGHIAKGNGSDVSGSSNKTGIDASNARVEGTNNEATGVVAHVQGEGNVGKFSQHVAGRFADIDTTAVDTVPTAGQKVEMIGWGTDDANRRTIRWLDDSGNEGIRGDHYLLQAGRSYNFGEGSNMSVGSDGDLVYRHPTGQKLFNGNFLYSWTYQGGGDYSNLTVDTLAETVIVDSATPGRNGIFPILSPGYFAKPDGSGNLSQGPIWIRVRGGYGVIGADPIMTVRVYFNGALTGNQLVAEMQMDLSAFPRVSGDNTGCEYLCWIEPINATGVPIPGENTRLRAHQKGGASRGNAVNQGSWMFSENETYTNINAMEQLAITVTAQWSALGSQTWAFFDGLEIFR